MTLKTKIITGLAALVMGLTPACGGDEGDTWPECKIRESYQGCEGLSGTYQVLETNCTNKYDEIFIWMGDDVTDVDYDLEDYCTHSSIGAIDKKSGELDCLKGACGDGYEITGNKVESYHHEFIKCDDTIMKMYWNSRECEAYLEKVAPAPAGYECECN